MTTVYRGGREGWTLPFVPLGMTNHPLYLCPGRSVSGDGHFVSTAPNQKLTRVQTQMKLDESDVR